MDCCDQNSDTFISGADVYSICKWDRVTWCGVAPKCKSHVHRKHWYKANMLSRGSLPQVLWHWWVICYAAAVILSVYDRCQIKFIFFLKASSQLLNRSLLSAAPRCSLVLGAMSSLITLSNKPKELEGGWMIILVHSYLMATWLFFFMQFCKHMSRIRF